MRTDRLKLSVFKVQLHDSNKESLSNPLDTLCCLDYLVDLLQDWSSQFLFKPVTKHHFDIILSYRFEIWENHDFWSEKCQLDEIFFYILHDLSRNESLTHLCSKWNLFSHFSYSTASILYKNVLQFPESLFYDDNKFRNERVTEGFVRRFFVVYDKKETVQGFLLTNLNNCFIKDILVFDRGSLDRISLDWNFLIK